MSVTLGLFELGGIVIAGIPADAGTEDVTPLCRTFEVAGLSIMTVPGSVPVGGT
jgi:hypothetical protein